MTPSHENRLKAAAFVVAAVGLASAQDAIIKSIAGALPAYEVVMIRCFVSGLVLALWLGFTSGLGSLRTPVFWPLVLRGLVLCAAYFSFILSIAAMPIANTVAIYFTMPLFVATLAGPFLGEQVPLYRWLAMLAGFAGVMIMVRPGAAGFEPASVLALLSAIGYAIGQMMGRHYSQRAEALVIANVQNTVVFSVACLMFIVFNYTGIYLGSHKSMVFLSRPFVVPETRDFWILSATGILAAFTTAIYTFAYKHAQSSFVAPFEYTAMIWAVVYGLVFFSDFPDAVTWSGMAVVVAAGFYMMWRDLRHKTG